LKAGALGEMFLRLLTCLSDACVCFSRAKDVVGGLALASYIVCFDKKSNAERSTLLVGSLGVWQNISWSRRGLDVHVHGTRASRRVPLRSRAFRISSFHPARWFITSCVLTASSNRALFLELSTDDPFLSAYQSPI
jgi:hypothetical protein